MSSIIKCKIKAQGIAKWSRKLKLHQAIITLMHRILLVSKSVLVNTEYTLSVVFQETLLYSTGQKVIHASYSLAKQGSTKAMKAQPIHF